MKGLFLILLCCTRAMALTNAVPAESLEFESTVFYSVTQYDQDLKETVTGYCNGNLISPQIMITAAHCVYMAEALGQKEIDLQVGEYRYVNTPAGERRKVGYVPTVKEKIRAQLFFTTALTQRLRTQGVNLRVSPHEDIAAVIFERPLNLKPGFQFTPMTSQQEVTALIAKIVDFAPTVVTINPFEEITTLDTKRMAQLDRITNSGGMFESKSQARVQPGDSGAPLFVRIGSQWKQIGVVKGRAETFFSNWDVFGILDQKLCDIARQVPDSSLRASLCF